MTKVVHLPNMYREFQMGLRSKLDRRKEDLFSSNKQSKMYQ